MKRNPVICLLVAGMLIISLTGQAAAAFGMACEGTASCCCRTADAIPNPGSDMAPMAGGCCDLPEPQPCDLAGPVSTPATPFLPAETSIDPDIAGKCLSTVSLAFPVIDGSPTACRSIGSPHRGGPPIYLLTQTFLC